MKNTVLPILFSTIWVNLSEFIRNEWLLKSYWTGHYANMGLEFPSEPVNGAIWGVWSLCFSIVVFMLSQKFDWKETGAIAWFAGFVLMWLVTGNMAVLPMGILPFAIPLSILEAYGAAYIFHRFNPVEK